MNTKAMLKLIKSPIKTHIDHHNGDLQTPSGVFNNDQSSLNYSHYPINFNTASVFIA